MLLDVSMFRTSLLGSLSSDVFERCTSTGSEPFPLLISLDAIVFLLPSVLILIEMICPKVCSKSRLKCAKSPLAVDVCRSKTSLLKLPIKSEIHWKSICIEMLSNFLKLIFLIQSVIALNMQLAIGWFNIRIVVLFLYC